MQPTESLEVHLPKDIIASLKKAVDSGQYAAADEIILIALEQWRIRQQILREELGALWDAGVASGKAEPFTLEDIMAEIHQKRLSK